MCKIHHFGINVQANWLIREYVRYIYVYIFIYMSIYIYTVYMIKITHSHQKNIAIIADIEQLMRWFPLYLPVSLKIHF